MAVYTFWGFIKGKACRTILQIVLQLKSVNRFWAILNDTEKIRKDLAMKSVCDYGQTLVETAR